MSKNITLKFYSDPGHGWLAVKRKLVDELNIADQISVYSYQKGATVYLEEDCDANKVVSLLKAQGNTVTFDERSTNSRSPIRGYDRFSKISA